MLGSCVVMEEQHLAAEGVGQVEGQLASLGVQHVGQLPPAPLELPSHTSVFKEEDQSVVRDKYDGMISPGCGSSVCIQLYSKDTNDL